MQRFHNFVGSSAFLKRVQSGRKAWNKEMYTKPGKPGVAVAAPHRKKVVRKLRKARPKGRKTGGFETEKLAYRHGKSSKISQGAKNFVRAAASQANTLICKAVGNYTSTKGLCVYFGSPMLYTNYDIYNMWANISANTSAKWVVEGVTQTNMVTNNDNAAVFLRVYECESRYDMPSAGGITNPIAALTTGFTDSGYTNGISDLSSTAFQSSLFCSKFKVRSVKLLKLQPGESIPISLSDQSRQNVNIERWYTGPLGGATPIIVAMARRSKFILIQAWGSPALDSAALTHVGTTGTNLSIYSTMRYDYRWVSDLTNTDVVVAAQLADGTTQTPYIIGGNPTFIETLTGAVVAETVA